MTIEYTSEQVLALAPDASSAKSGQDLANTRKWQSLAMGGAALWGECQGSGSKPYQTRVDLDGPAFKCSCPSRKFPCKHGIGLLLLHSLSRASFREAEPPAWVSDWLATRREKVAKKDKAEENRTPEQLEEARLAKEKRRANRMESVRAGVEELELFLSDLIRQGVGQIKNESYSYFEARAARLVDAQAPGLARLIRECASITSSKTNWQETLLNRLATIYLIARAFRNLQNLSPEMQEDVLAAVGFTQSQEALLTSPEAGIKDNWYVVGQSIYNEDRLRVQKSFLWGTATRRVAMVLSFAHGTAPFDVIIVPGHFYEAELVYYPSVYPLRALLKSQTNSTVVAGTTNEKMPQGITSIEEALKEYARALSCLPWLEELPLLLSQQTLVADTDNSIYITDKTGAALPLATRDSAGWQLLAFSSGLPLSLFGQFDGVKFTPLSAVHDSRGSYLRLATGEV
ncbi:MAG: SWIM zinc finger family protein [Cyanobacteria bacterium SZAS LIN-3]|nr:SWIM zinc finger family protein [Cyanobacteria bacterium SZAS LIN-3]